MLTWTLSQHPRHPEGEQSAGGYQVCGEESGAGRMDLNMLVLLLLRTKKKIKYIYLLTDGCRERLRDFVQAIDRIRILRGWFEWKGGRIRRQKFDITACLLHDYLLGRSPVVKLIGCLAGGLTRTEFKSSRIGNR